VDVREEGVGEEGYFRESSRLMMRDFDFGRAFVVG
jgi:hypothetical protein